MGVYIKINKKIIITVTILCIIGLIMVYSSSMVLSEYKYGNQYRYVLLQFIFMIIGFTCMYIFSNINYLKYKNKANILIGICFLLLILVLIPGVGSVRNGSRSWFSIFGFGFQPSEITKLSLIIFVSKYLSKNDKLKKYKYNFMLPILGVILIFFILILLEPDFGSDMVMLCTLIGLIFISGTDVSIFIKLGVIGLIGIVILVLIAPYRLDRITSYLNPWSDPLGSGFQAIQSMYAIGPGGILGLGFLKSRQKHFYLPESHTDFIFSIIAEEFGLLGCTILLILFLYLFYLLITLSLKIKDLYGKYLSFGLSFLLMFQTILNIGVVVGLFPITGVTLPFISYGGSSLLVSLSSIGIILNINKNNL